jgi:spermidine/putrescine transport system ATP-binding protein
MARELITLEHIYKSYGDQLVLDDLSLMIKENSFVTLLGPSGCGKTTTLRIIGGFEYPDSGAVVFDGKNITDLSPNKRNLNTVF